MTAKHSRAWTRLAGAASLTLGLAAPFFAPLAAQAYGGQGTAVVVRAAYLKSAPILGWNNVVQLERTGTEMAVLGKTGNWYHVQLAGGRSGYITANPYWVKEQSGNTGGSSSVPAPAPSPAFTLPPGVTLDPSITPIAPTTASPAAKFAAVLQVAQSKLGTPYIWGHNEDRGQYGFDCSNFVEYVFHHALGYHFSTASKTQYQSVGTPVPLSSMQPGDLLFFSDNTNPTGSAHVGIYIGNGQMIQEGGGLAKVGYLSVTTGYWSHHLVAAHRMF